MWEAMIAVLLVSNLPLNSDFTNPGQYEDADQSHTQIVELSQC